MRKASPTNQVERGLRLGVALYVTLLVVLPLLCLVHFGLADGLHELWRQITEPIARSALWLTIWTALLVGILNIVVGTAIAWILVRYSIPGRAALSAAIDLPLAIPTLVAGVMLAILYGPTSMIGRELHLWHIDIMFARPGIILVLLFVTLPLVVRAVEPVLTEIDPAEEEAANVLGAGPWRTFRAVFLPAIAPAAMSAGMRSLGRALGEFGGIVIVAGNLPFRTLTAPVFIFGEIESGNPHGAAAVSTVLLLFALAAYLSARALELLTGARNAAR